MSEQLLDFLLYGLPSLFLWHYADGDVHIAGSITASKQLGRANYFHFNEAVKFLFCPILFLSFFLSFFLSLFFVFPLVFGGFVCFMVLIFDFFFFICVSATCCSTTNNCWSMHDTCR